MTDKQDEDYYTFQGVPQGISAIGGDAVPRVTTMDVHCDGCNANEAVVRVAAKAGYNNARSLRLCKVCGWSLVTVLGSYLGTE